MKVLILIPARYASTRFPGKPLAKIGNKSVISMVVEKASEVSDFVFVATDDERICSEVKSLGYSAIMTSENHKSGTDRCYEAYEKVRERTGECFDVVVNIQGDEPFINVAQIRSLIACFENEKVQIATLAKQMTTLEDVLDPNKVKVVFGADNMAVYFSRYPIPYCRGVEKEKMMEKTDFYKHIGMYAYRPDVLREITSLEMGKLEQAESLEQLRWLENSYKIAVRLTEFESIGIDTPEDLRVANEYYLTLNNN